MKSLKKNLLLFVASYFVISVLWILFSDRAVHSLVRDESLNLAVQTYKGWGFVLITSVIIYIVLGKRDRRILRAQEELRSIYDAVNDSIVVHDAKTGKILDVNRRMVEQFGFTLEELLDGPLYIDAHRGAPYTKENALDLIRKTVIDGPQLFERHCRRKDRTRFWAEISLRHTVINGNDCVLAAIRDISQRKNDQEALSRMQKLESLGVLAGGIAHDFNNLLGGLFGYIEVARDSIAASPDKALDAINKALDVFDRAKGLTRQLLTFAKGGAPEKELVALGPLLDKTIQFALSGSNVTAGVSVATDLWPCEIDKTQIGQVIDNIIINARQAMPSGGSIAIDARNMTDPALLPLKLPGNSFVRIVVADQGTGIPPENLKHVFDPFFTTKKQGSGLGLSTAFSIVTRHEGAIDIQSEPGRGTTVSVFLPASPHLSINRQLNTPTATEPGGARVLILDDENAILEVCRRLLEQKGYVVVTARSGDEALELARSLPHFDAAILDLTIPAGKGGAQIVRALRDFDPHIKTIASSGYCNDPVMANPGKFGFHAKLNKPYSSQDLSAVLAAVNS